MDYTKLKERITITTATIQQLGGDVMEVRIDEPATAEQIQQVEQQLGFALPVSFKEALEQFSAHFSLRWFLPDELERPHEFREIFAGLPHWSLELLVQLDADRKSWVSNVFSDEDNPYDAVWHNKLPFCEVGNGDYLAFDLRDTTDAPIVYLNHEGGEGHGYKLANNFSELLENWSRLGFVGCEDWQWLPFTTSAMSGLLPDSEAAERFRAWLGLPL